MKGIPSQPVSNTVSDCSNSWWRPFTEHVPSHLALMQHLEERLHGLSSTATLCPHSWNVHTQANHVGPPLREQYRDRDDAGDSPSANHPPPHVALMCGTSACRGAVRAPAQEQVRARVPGLLLLRHPRPPPQGQGREGAPRRGPASVPPPQNPKQDSRAQRCGRLRLTGDVHKGVV
jgi:hypothetical protein